MKGKYILFVLLLVSTNTFAQIDSILNRVLYNFPTYQDKFTFKINANSDKNIFDIMDVLQFTMLKITKHPYIPHLKHPTASAIYFTDSNIPRLFSTTFYFDLSDGIQALEYRNKLISELEPYFKKGNRFDYNSVNDNNIKIGESHTIFLKNKGETPYVTITLEENKNLYSLDFVYNNGVEFKEIPY